MQNICPTTVLLACVSASCASRPSETMGSPHQGIAAATSVTTDEALPPLERRFAWAQTREDRATLTAITQLTIPGLFKEKEVDIPCERYEMVDANGLMQLPPGPFGRIESADGYNAKGGYGFNGGIDARENVDDANSIIFHISYSWTTADCIRGHIDENVPVKVGTSADVQLTSGCHLRISWRAAPPPPP